MADSIQIRRERCLRSVFWTGWYLCNYRRLSFVLHWAVAAWLQKKRSEGFRRIAVLIPRDYYKTSLLGVAGVVNYLLNNPENTVLYMMHKTTLAAEKMDEVRAAFESKTMKLLFPDLHVGKEHKKSARWGNNSFTIPRQGSLKGAPSVTCSGLITGSVGGHFDLIIWDDPIKGDDEDAMGQINLAISKSRKLTFLWKNRRKSEWWVFGTMWEGGFYENILARTNFAHLVLGCYVDERFEELIKYTKTPLPDKDSEYAKTRILPENLDLLWDPGQPVFPEQETMQSLEDAKIDAGPDFDTQMLNIPSDVQRRRFIREDIQYYDISDLQDGVPTAVLIDGIKYPLKSALRTLTVDPSGGMSKEADAAAVTVCAWFRESAFVVFLDYWNGQDNPKVQIENTLRLAQKWDVRYIAPEWNAYQVTYSFWLLDLMKKLNLHYEIDPYKRGIKSKATWIYDSLFPYVKNHQVFFHRTDHREVINQLVGLKTRNGQVLGPSPGLVDSFTMHRKFWTRRYARKQNLVDEVPTEKLQETLRRTRPVPYGLRLAAFNRGLEI